MRVKSSSMRKSQIEARPRRKISRSSAKGQQSDAIGHRRGHFRLGGQRVMGSSDTVTIAPCKPTSSRAPADKRRWPGLNCKDRSTGQRPHAVLAHVGERHQLNPVVKRGSLRQAQGPAPARPASAPSKGSGAVGLHLSATSAQDGRYRLAMRKNRTCAK
jgi:hypothetical protein